MQVTIELPDELGRKFQAVQHTEGIDKLLASHISQILQEQSEKNVPQETQIDRIFKSKEKNEVDLKGYSTQLKKDVKEFREEFSFKHDE